jgi:hypothetical protein
VSDFDLWAQELRPAPAPYTWAAPSPYGAQRLPAPSPYATPDQRPARGLLARLARRGRA